MLRGRQGARKCRFGSLLALACGAAVSTGASAGAPGGRLFASVNQCESAAALPAGTCRTAFANALTEFSAKAPTFGSRRACFKAFGPCMPWPMGTHRFSQFRPQWIGIVVGPDGTAAPAVAPGRLALAFASQPATALSAAAATRASDRSADDPPATILTPDDEGGDGGPVPRAGGGFTVIDGVLTYPAPARFQPKALKRP